MAITEVDYPKLTELLTLKHIITLDCERGGYTEEELENETDSIYLNYGGNEDFYGNIESSYLEGLHGWDPELQQKALSSRFRTFVQENGEIGLEISYIPGEPIDNENFEEHAKALWDETRLHEIMDYDSYIQDLREGADWIGDCFGTGGEMYGLLIEVTKPGRNSSLEKIGYDPILPKPLWIQRKGQKFNVHIHCWQD